MFNIHLKVIIEKKWRTQNFYFLSLKSSSPGQFLGSSKVEQKWPSLSAHSIWVPE